MITGALAVAAIVLVQGSGVADAAPNRDGTGSDANRDFVAQGIGNAAAGFFRGVYGSLLYAGSRTLQAKLPDPAGAEAPTVVLRMRGRTAVGATFVKVVEDYATALDAVGGRLYLSGVDHAVAKLLRRTDRTGASEPVGVFEATEVVGESTTQGLREAESWAVRRRPPNSDQ